jgi:hypothetical protein
MTESDAQKIEQGLGLTIPSDLRSIWLNYPLKAEAGNTERCIWDNADSIISENLRLRNSRKWPSSLLFIGSDGAGNQFAVNLAAPEMPVGVEFEDPERQFDPLEQWGVKRKTISAWFTAVIKEMVEEEGYDIETGKTDQGGVGTSILILIVGVLIVCLIFFVTSLGMKFAGLLFHKLFGS